MSLKHFHLVFIIAALVACFGFAAYAFLLVSAPAVKDQLMVGGWCALTLGVVLSVYAPFWLKKSRTIAD